MLSVLCNYHYDPLDRLTSDSSPSTPVRHRFYCKSHLATEIQGAIAHSIVQHDAQLLAQQQRKATALDTTLLATDLQRSVLHTLNNDTQSQPIAYSPYGHRPASDGLLSLLGFNGERPNPVTGHYLLGNGYRAFNPVLMRFNSPDSWSPFGEGGLNPYSYCLGDPIGKADPTGHIPRWIARIVGTKSTYVPSFGPNQRALWTKSGYTPKEGLKASKKIGDLERRADKLVNNARNEVLSQDTEFAYSFNTPYRPTGSLEISAYNTFRFETHKTTTNVFDFLTHTKKHYNTSQFETALLQTQTELTALRPILNKLNLYPKDAHILSRFPRISPDDTLTQSYYKRLESISHPEAHALREEASRIRNKVFK
ncbi:RHS repeat-associated core domain-containing protein [Pseudomonas sp. Irchel s3b2]|uniref:RHS repeat-associated core domain-containing protein n=1 Tax=Pseudomonas sp. Irchel s3b2 TaxID=2009073 RepID=UPI000BA38772|nr:RHS repeat-associated core domain-containing protein [Pseudomonas sp. Irchel s3b2]